MRGKIMSRLNYITVFIAILAISSAVYSWYRPPQLVTQTEYVEVPKEKIVTKIKTVTVPGPERIVTIEKEKIVEKLGLPDWIKNNPDKQVIGNADVPCDDSISGHSVIAIMDTKTGEGSIIAKSKPLPFMSFANDREIGVRYGVSTQAPTQVDIYARWDFVRIGAMKFGVYGEANSQAEAKAMVQAGYHW